MRMVGLLLMLMAALPLDAQQFLLYVGTFTRQTSKGIYVYRFDAKTGKASALGLAAETPSPAWLTLHPNGKVLYAANEIGDYQGLKSGSVSAFGIDHGTGLLEKMNTVPSRGDGPCHIAVDEKGQVLFAANYGGGSVAAFPIKPGGSLGEATGFVQFTGSGTDPLRQKEPHAHSANIAPGNKRVLVADLGTDKIYSYNFDLTPASPAFGQVKGGLGPRHMVFSGNGKFAYVVNEMASSVTVFDYDEKTGAMKEVQTVSALPAGFTGKSTAAEIVLHPSGKFLYTSNRGSDTVAVFRVEKGMLTAADFTATGGKNPRNFSVDPTGQWLLAANQDTNNIVVFKIDKKTGKLTATGEKLEVSMPVSLLWLR